MRTTRSHVKQFGAASQYSGLGYAAMDCHLAVLGSQCKDSTDAVH